MRELERGRGGGGGGGERERKEVYREGECACFLGVICRVEYVLASASQSFPKRQKT